LPHQAIEERGILVDKKIMDLHEEYTHGSLDRREFMKRLTVLAGGTAAAGAILPLLESNYAQAAGVAKDDSRLNTEYITYPGATGDVRALFARPKGNAKLPGVVVIHQNKGLEPHIEDVTRRIASEGFQAVAPDALSPVGGTPADADKAIKMQAQLDGPSTIKNFVAAVQYLKTHSLSTGKVGVVGFCWGGEMANKVAVNSPDLIAAVPYYGLQPAAGDVPKIKASLLLHYAGIDEGTNKGIPAYEDALKKASIDYKLYIYEGAKHAFNDDTRPDRYHQEAAALAWQRTIDFLNKKLKT
jgi:carboxymethylenebutenolidase